MVLFAFYSDWIIYDRRSYRSCLRDFVRERIYQHDICRSPYVILMDVENFILPRDITDIFMIIFWPGFIFIFLPFYENMTVQSYCIFIILSWFPNFVRQNTQSLSTQSCSKTFKLVDSFNSRQWNYVCLFFLPVNFM